MCLVGLMLWQSAVLQPVIRVRSGSGMLQADVLCWHSTQEVDPRLGTWEDVKGSAEKLDLELELMVNHVSPASTEFRDFIKEGDAAEHADMFIDWDRFWPDGEDVRTCVMRQIISL